MRKTLIVALACKLLIALWRPVHDGIVPEGLQMRPAAPQNWGHFCDSVTDNFRAISPTNFRVMT
jgi:hypothetical protein